MSGGKKTPTTFNGNAINDGTVYTSKFLLDSGVGDIAQFEEISAEIAGQFPDFIRAQPDGKVLKLRVEIIQKGAGGGAGSHWANRHQLHQWFNPSDGEVLLKATDDGGNTLRLTVVALTVLSAADTDYLFDVLLYVPDPNWLNDTENDHTKTVSSGAAWTDAGPNDGNDDVRPTVTMTPQGYKANTAGRNKMRRVVMAWRSPMPGADIFGNDYPIEITNGGWDVETKIKAGELHPQGYDILAYLDGVPTERYLSNYGAGYGTNAVTGANSDHTFGAIRSFCVATCRHAVKFRLPGCSEKETNTIDEVQLPLDKVGAPGGNLQVEIRVDNGGVPGALVTDGTSNTVAVSGVPASGSGAWVAFTFPSNPVLNAKTWYWLVLLPPTGTNNSTNYVRTGFPSANAGKYENEVNTMAHSTDGVSWTTGAALDGVGGNHTVSDYFGPLNFRMFTVGLAQIWVSAYFDGTIKLNTNGIPAGVTAMKITDFEGYARLPERFYAVRDSECLLVAKSSADRFSLTIGRARRGTAAAPHAAGPMYWAQHYVQLVFNYQEQQPSKPVWEPDGKAPVIDGVRSTNAKFYWIGPFLSPSVETRPMTWAPEQDDDADGFELVSLDGDAASDLTDVTFKDLSPTGAFIAKNAIAQDFPTGIKAAANAITIDEPTIAASLQLEHRLTNSQGEPELLATHRSTDQGTGKQMTPADEAYRWQIRAVNSVVVGAEASGGADLAVTSTSPKAQTLTLTEQATFRAIGFKIKELTGTPPTTNLFIDLYAVNDDENESVDTSVKLMVTQEVAPSETTTDFGLIIKTLATPVTLAAGKYAFVFTTTESANGYALQASDGTVYAGGEARSGGQVTLDIAATYDADINDTPTIDAASTTIQIGTPTDTGSERGILKFPLTSLPAGAEVATAQLKVEVTTASSAINPTVVAYGDTADVPGQPDPAVDSAATMRTRSTGSGMPSYGSFAAFSSTGIKSVTLGSSISGDIEAAKAAVDRFSVTLRDLGAGSGEAQIAAIEHASAQEARLAITYSPAATEAYTTKFGQDVWFQVYGSPLQEDAPQGTGGTADVDNPIVDLDDVTPGTPLVIFESSDQSVYHLIGELRCAGGGEVGMDALMFTAKTMVLNFETRNFTHNDPDIVVECAYIFTSLNEADPFPIPPGTVSLTLTDPSPNINVRVQYREKFRG